MILQFLVLVRAPNWSRWTCLPHFDGTVPGPGVGALAQPRTHVGDVRTPRSRTAGFNSSLGARGTSALIILHAALGSDERARPACEARRKGGVRDARALGPARSRPPDSSVGLCAVFATWMPSPQPTPWSRGERRSTVPRLRTLNRGFAVNRRSTLSALPEEISSNLKGDPKVCHRQLVNEVLGFLVTELARNLGREGPTPIQRGFNTSPLGRVQAVKLIRHNALQPSESRPSAPLVVS